MIQLSPDFFIKESFVKEYDSILGRGLSSGIGDRDGQMCIEAAVCTVLGLDHGDDPRCVTDSIRAFKMGLNDSSWSSPEARAKGLRNLGLAQLGSKGVVSDRDFLVKLSEKIIRTLIPSLFREIFTDSKCLAASDRCEIEGTLESAEYAAECAAEYAEYAAEYAAKYAAEYAKYAAEYAKYAAKYAKYAAKYAAEFAEYAARRAVRCAARAAAKSARYTKSAGCSIDKYLLLSANLALEVLTELSSPGCKLLTSE